MSEAPNERQPDPASATAAPELTKTQLEERIKARKREMQTQPCYRCQHSEAEPNTTCVCCRSAHTPDIDGEFKESE